MLFTAEELAEIAAADAEIEAGFFQTYEEIRQSRKRDREFRLDGLPFDKRKIAAAKKEYYEANREKIAAAKKGWIDKNRDHWNAYQREYRARRKAACAR